MAEICGVCKQEFKNTDEYLAHTCVTGFTPVQPEHLGDKFVEASQAAVERGAEKQRLIDEGLKPKDAQKQAQETVNEKHARIA